MKEVKNKYGIKVGDIFCESIDTWANFYQVVSVTEGGVYVKETDKKASNIGGRGYEKMIVPVLNRFKDTKAPEYKRIMVDKYSASPVVYFKTGRYEFARAYLLKGRKGIQVTDSQFW